MEHPPPTSGIASRYIPESRIRRYQRRRDRTLSDVDDGVQKSEHPTRWVAPPGFGIADNRLIPARVSFLAKVIPVSRAAISDVDYGPSDSATAPLAALASSTSKSLVNSHTQHLDEKLPDSSGNPWSNHYMDTLNYLRNANFLALSEAAASQPLMNRIYPSVLTYDLLNGDDAVLSVGGSKSKFHHEPTLGSLGHLGLSKQMSYNFDNVKHINNFFMADETRLPIYIAAFGTGFFSVLICLCAILYTKYLFSKVRRVKGSARHYKTLSTVPLLDKEMLLEAQSHDNLAETRAMNPSLARIEDYISGEVKKWERRVCLAEESAGSPGGFNDVINSLESDADSDDDSAFDDGGVTTMRAPSNNVTFDNLFRGHTRFDGSRIVDGASDSSNSSESESDDSDEYSSDDDYYISSSEYTDSSESESESED